MLRRLSEQKGQRWNKRFKKNHTVRNFAIEPPHLILY
jgi:hypothetical protein